MKNTDLTYINEVGFVVSVGNTRAILKWWLQ